MVNNKPWPINECDSTGTQTLTPTHTHHTYSCFYFVVKDMQMKMHLSVEKRIFKIQTKSIEDESIGMQSNDGIRFEEWTIDKNISNEMSWIRIDLVWFSSHTKFTLSSSDVMSHVCVNRSIRSVSASNRKCIGVCVCACTGVWELVYVRAWSKWMPHCIYIKIQSHWDDDGI